MPSRSVVEFNTPRGLRQALQSVDEERSLSDDSNSNHDLSGIMDFSANAVQDEQDVLDENWDWVLENYDAGTTNPQSIIQELHRLQVLKSYTILDQDREDAFERLTGMASRIFQVPIALVSLVDLGRQWFMSNLGLGDVRETPRKLAFCAHAIQGKNDIFVVKDALEDPRFCDSPLVTGAPFIRFYAGAPLLSPEGYKLGTFCIIDSKPRPDGMSPDDQANLIDFAAMAMDAMVKRRQITAQNDTGHLVACTAHDLLTPLMGVQLSLSLMQEDAALLADTHKESLSNAIRSSDWLHRICQTTMDTLRDSGSKESARTAKECPLLNLNGAHTHHLASTGEMPTCTCGSGHDGEEDWAASPFIDMEAFVASLNDTMESIPKRVPLIVTVDDSVPKSIVSDELKLFRSSLNLLSNAFSNTSTGSIKFQIHATGQHLVFECTDTGNDLQIDENDIQCLFKPCLKTVGVAKNLGLYSVGYQIESLGGSYGYRPRADEGRRGSIFWFRVPILLPEDVSLAASISEFSGMDLVDTLESSVKHFPAAIHPANDTSSDHEPDDRLPPSRRTSNRSGMLAVAAAAIQAVPQSASCCGLDELANYKDIDSYKACQRRQGGGGMRRTGSLAHSTSNASSSMRPTAENGIVRSQSLDNPNGPLRKPPVSDITIVTATINSEAKAFHDGTCSNTGESTVNDLRAAMEKVVMRPEDASPRIDSQNAAPSLSTPSALVDHLILPKSSPTHPVLLQQPAMNPLPILKAFPTDSKLNGVEKAPSLLNEVSNEEKKGDTEPLDNPRQKKALVIEDTLIVRKTLTRALQKRGYEVTQAVDGLEGLDALKETVFDITLCDFLMPNMDGLDCVQQYRQWEEENRTFRQRIVGISAHVSHKDIDKGLEIGMDDFKSKPITIRTLQELDECPAMDRVREMLSKMEAPKANGNQPVNASASPKGKSCLMATVRCNAESSETAKKMTSTGWQVTIVNDGTSALEQLKLRNWGAVILDDDLPNLPGNVCVEEFRAWESQNRVNRQDNLFIVCTDVLLANPETKMLPPAGFDGAVDSQMSWSQIQSMMAKQTGQSADTMRSGLSIVTR